MRAMARWAHGVARSAIFFREIEDFYAFTPTADGGGSILRAIGGSGFTDDRICMPENQLARQNCMKRIPVTYLPFRNALFSFL